MISRKVFNQITFDNACELKELFHEMIDAVKDKDHEKIGRCCMQFEAKISELKNLSFKS